MKFDAREFLEGLYQPTRAGSVAIAAPTELLTWAQKAAAILARIGNDDVRIDLRERFEERAGTVEYDGNLPRDEAERIAYEELRRALELANYRSPSGNEPAR